MRPVCSTQGKRQNFATCVDAPFGAREIFRSGVARGQVLTCVDAPFGAREIFRSGVARGQVLTCVDAPLGAREIFRSGVARGQVLTCVRPLMRLRLRLTRRRPGWEMLWGERRGTGIIVARQNDGVPPCPSSTTRADPTRLSSRT